MKIKADKSKGHSEVQLELYPHVTRAGVKLSSEAIQSPALPLEGVHNVHGSDSLPLGMLSVGDSISDDILQENLGNTPGLLIDETTDPLHTTSPCESSDCRLGDTLDVVPQHLAMPLGTTLAQAFASLASSPMDGWLLYTQ